MINIRSLSRTFLALCILGVSLPIASMENRSPDLQPDDPVKVEIDWAFNKILENNGPIFGTLTLAIYRIGEAFERLWERLVGTTKQDMQAAGLHPEPDPSEEPGAPAGLAEQGGECQDVIKGIEQLQAESSKLLQQADTLGLDADHRKALNILSDNATKAVSVDKMAMGVGLTLLYWIYKKNPGHHANEAITIIRKARTQTRFVTGLEIPTVIAATKAMVGPFLKPIICLALGSYLLIQLRKAAAFPERLKIEKMKHQSEVAKFKRAQLAHEDKIKGILTRQTQEEIERLKALEKDFAAKLEKERKRNEALEAQLNKKMDGVMHDSAASNAQVRQQLADERRKLLEQMADLGKKVEERTKALDAAAGTLNLTASELEELRGELVMMKFATDELDSKVGEAVPALEDLRKKVGTLAADDQQIMEKLQQYVRDSEGRQNLMLRIMQRRQELESGAAGSAAGTGAGLGLNSGASVGLPAGAAAGAGAIVLRDASGGERKRG